MSTTLFTMTTDEKRRYEIIVCRLHLYVRQLTFIHSDDTDKANQHIPFSTRVQAKRQPSQETEKSLSEQVNNERLHSASGLNTTILTTDEKVLMLTIGDFRASAASIQASDEQQLLQTK